MKFKIEYRAPETGEQKVVYSVCNDTPGIARDTVTAREWAEDEAYFLANGGPFTVTEAKP